MTHKFEAQFLDYLEDKLTSAEKAEFEEALKNDVGLAVSYKAYKDLLNLEKACALPNPELSAGFEARVMQAIEEKVLEVGFFRRLYMELALNKRMAIAGLASLAALALCLDLVLDGGRQKYSVQESVSRAKEIAAPVVVQHEAQTPAVPPKLPNDIQRKEADALIGPIVPLEAGSREDHSQKLTAKKTNEEKEMAPERRRQQAVSSTAYSNLYERSSSDMKADSGSYAIQVDALKSSASGGKKPEQEISGKVIAGDKAYAIGKSGEITSKGKDEEYEPTFAKSKNEQASNLPATSSLEGWSYDDRWAGQTSPPIDNSAYRRLYTEENREAYTAWDENPRILVQTEPMSTFSIDVDTGSYTNARRFLQSGQLPPKDSVRIEEFINYFKYDYPSQADKAFAISYEMAPSALEPGRHLLKLGIKSKDSVRQDKPWNLVFLVDTSGSMNEPNKLPLVKQALKILVNNMRSEDRVAIVTYAGSAGLVLDSTKGNERSRILSSIDYLSPGGSTYGSAGLQLAYEVAQKYFIQGTTNRVVLATDGDFNVGITSDSDLIRLIEEKGRSGVTLTTLGFGTGNLQEGKMEQLANKGNGNYFYIDSFQEARKVMESDLAGNMEVVAKDVKLQIEFNPAHVKEYRLIGYDNRKLRNEDFNNDAIDAGEIGTGHTVTALYEIVLKGSSVPSDVEYRYKEKARQDEVKAAPATDAAEFAFLKIRFKAPESNTSELLNYPLMAKDIRTSAQEVSSDFKFAQAVAYFGHLLRASKYLGSYGYDDVLKLAESGKGNDEFGYRSEFIEIVKNAKAVR